MSEKPTNGPESQFASSAAMTANNSQWSCASRACAASKPLIVSGCFYRNKRLSTQEPLIMSGFRCPTTQNWVRFASDRILEHFLMFSTRWVSFRIFPLSASLRVNLRPNDFPRSPMNGFVWKNAILWGAGPGVRLAVN